MKKCPPGVICIENVTMFFIFIVLIIIGYLIYTNYKQTNNISEENIKVESNISFVPQNIRPNYPYNNLVRRPADVLLDPYVPPLKDERYFVPEISYIPPGTIPINVSTNIGAVDTTYRQLGILTPLNSNQKNNILPLMGRPLFTSRQKFQYYTISNQHNNIKLPVSVKGRSGLNDYGVDEIYSGDTVYVEGYNDAFKVTMYETNTIKYLPYL